MNAENGRPKGFAFVQFENKAQAEHLIAKLNDSLYKGRRISLEFAVDQRLYNARKTSEQISEEEEKSEKIEKEEASENEKEENSDAENSSEKMDKKTRRKIQKDRKLSRKDKRKMIFGEATPENQANLQKDGNGMKLEQQSLDELKSTIFASNVNFELTNEQFKTHARKLGKLIYAVVILKALQK